VDNKKCRERLLNDGFDRGLGVFQERIFSTLLNRYPRPSLQVRATRKPTFGVLLLVLINYLKVLMNPSGFAAAGAILHLQHSIGHNKN
jgi:hypothetical protein